MKRVCDVEGCGLPNWAHGYCNMHYARFRRHGDTDKKGWGGHTAGIDRLAHNCPHCEDGGATCAYEAVDGTVISRWCVRCRQVSPL